MGVPFMPNVNGVGMKDRLIVTEIYFNDPLLPRQRNKGEIKMKLTDEELLRRWKYLNGCHYIDLKLRRDGQNVDMEGDWLKDIMQELVALRGIHSKPIVHITSIKETQDEKPG